MKILSFVIMSLEIDQALENIAISFCHFIYSSILLNYEMYSIVIGCFGEGGFSPRKS